MKLEKSKEEQRKSWRVEIDSIFCIVFATTKAKAQYIAVRSYWDAYGKTRSWPRAVVSREPRYDTSYLSNERQQAWAEDYVSQL